MNIVVDTHVWDDDDDPVVWQHGKALPDGRARVFVLTRKSEQAIVATMGRAWLDAYLADKVAELAKWGVH